MSSTWVLPVVLPQQLSRLQKELLGASHGGHAFVTLT
jgi:hypothetical protein